MVEQFPIVLRGYDKDRVDEAFASAQETVNRLREQVKADDQTILELQAQLQEEKNKKAAPKSFASLGANAQQMLASAEQTSAELLERAKKDASAARATVQGQALWLLQPQTFMNLSGKSVGALARFFKIQPEQILVAHDELDFAPGQVKLKKGGSHGGHNGLRDIHAQLGLALIHI